MIGAHAVRPYTEFLKNFADRSHKVSPFGGVIPGGIDSQIVYPVDRVAPARYQAAALHGDEQVHGILGLYQGSGAIAQLIGHLSAGGAFHLHQGDAPDGLSAAGVALVVEIVLLQNGVGHVIVNPLRPDLEDDGPFCYGGAGVGLPALEVQRGGHHNNHGDDQHVDDADFAEQTPVPINDLHPFTSSMATMGPLPM